MPEDSNKKLSLSHIFTVSRKALFHPVAATLLSAVFLSALGTTIAFTFMEIFMVLHGLSYLVVGAISSLSYFVALLTRIPMTAVTEKAPLKSSITLGLCLYFVAPICISLDPVLPVFVLANLLLGLGSSLFVPATMALIAVTFSDKDLKTSVITTYMSFISLGALFGPIIGGALFIYSVSSLNLAFIMSGTISGFAAIAVTIGLSSGKKAEASPKPVSKEPLPAGYWRSILNVIVYYSAYSFVLSTSAFIVIFAYFKLSYAIVILGALISVLMALDAVVQYLCGPLFLRFPKIDFGRIFMIVSAASFVPLILLSRGYTLVLLFVLAYGIFFLGRNVGSSFASKNFMLSLPSTRPAYVSSIVGSVGLCAGGVGLLLSGFLYTLSPIYVWIVFMLCAAAIGIALPSTRIQPASNASVP